MKIANERNVAAFVNVLIVNVTEEGFIVVTVLKLLLLLITIHHIHHSLSLHLHP